MKRKMIFISSLAISLILVGAVVFTFFPDLKNLWTKKTVALQIVQTDSPSPALDQPAAQNADTTQNTQSDWQPLDNQPPQSKSTDQPATVAPTTPPAASSPTPTQSATGKIVPDFVSWGFQKASGRTIEAIIIHSSYNALSGDPFDFSKVVQEWKTDGVSPHYAIDRSGTIYQLVADQNIAYHAGVSKLPDGKTDVNGVSIGVEMINTQTAKFTDAQYSSLNSLIATLKGKYPIKYILGHDQIAPGRKTDPWNIDWSKVIK